MMNIAALIILFVFSFIGFIAIFFTTFGTLIMLVGFIVYAAMTGFGVLGGKTLLLLFGLYFLGELAENLFLIIGAKKMGASNAAVFGAIAGGIAGAALGASFFGIGVFFGAIAGVFAGAFLVEAFIQRDLYKSLRAGMGSVFGRVGSIAVKVVIALIMLFLVIGKIV